MKNQKAIMTLLTAYRQADEKFDQAQKRKDHCNDFAAIIGNLQGGITVALIQLGYDGDIRMSQKSAEVDGEG